MQSTIRSRAVGAELRLNPQSAICHAENANSLHAFEPGTAWAQERLQNWSSKLARGAFCAP
eukprot:5971498-Alexandrium_andersonii.AAC.1